MRRKSRTSHSRVWFTSSMDVSDCYCQPYMAIRVLSTSRRLPRGGPTLDKNPSTSARRVTAQAWALPTVAERRSADLESVRGRSGDRADEGQPSHDVGRWLYAVRTASRANPRGDPEPHTEPSLRERLRR